MTDPEQQSEYDFTAGNKKAIRITDPDRPAKAESWKYDDGVTAKTAAALFTTADISLFSHFDSLTFTKSAAVEAATVTLRMRPGSRAIVVISGLTGETIAITGTIDGIATSAILSYTTGNTAAAAATLGNGTFYLEV